MWLSWIHGSRGCGGLHRWSLILWQALWSLESGGHPLHPAEWQPPFHRPLWEWLWLGPWRNLQNLPGMILLWRWSWSVQSKSEKWGCLIWTADHWCSFISSVLFNMFWLLTHKTTLQEIEMFLFFRTGFLNGMEFLKKSCYDGKFLQQQPNLGDKSLGLQIRTETSKIHFNKVLKRE